MRRIKRLISLAFALCLLSAFAIPADAASNTDAILAALRSGINVGGKTVMLPESYANQAENYFVSHTITDEQANYILAQINTVKSEIRSKGITDLHKVDPSTKQEILAAARNAANKIDLKLTVGSDKTVKVIDSKGAIAFSDDNVIKTTGPSIDGGRILLFFFLPFLLVVGACVICIVRYRLLEREDE